MSITNLFREIQSLAPARDPDAFVDDRAKHAFAAARKLFEVIERTYSEEDAADLVKRFVNALKSGDYRKFDRGMRRLMESKNARLGRP